MVGKLIITWQGSRPSYFTSSEIVVGLSFLFMACEQQSRLSHGLSPGYHVISILAPTWTFYRPGSHVVLVFAPTWSQFRFSCGLSPGPHMVLVLAPTWSPLAWLPRGLGCFSMMHSCITMIARSFLSCSAAPSPSLSPRERAFGWVCFGCTGWLYQVAAPSGTSFECTVF